MSMTVLRSGVLQISGRRGNTNLVFAVQVELRTG
jgi:hypothetical protein